MQLLFDAADSSYFVAMRRGRVEEPGQCAVKQFDNLARATKEFEKVFRNKTRNVWGTELKPQASSKYILDGLLPAGSKN